MKKREYEDFYWLTENSRNFLSKGYVDESIGETAESRYWDIAKTAEDILKLDGFADKFYGYLKKGYYSISSPITSNFGSGRGLSISCNGSLPEDNITSILGKVAEIGAMTKQGAGTSAFLGKIRGRGEPISIGGESFGSVHFMQLFDCVTNIISQGSTRRGYCAVYLPVEHPDIEEFLTIRSDGHAIQNLAIGVTITDDWMRSMIDGDSNKRKIWGKIIKKRFETGFPYIFWTDTANNNKPQIYKDKNKTIYASNLCNEISLPSSEDESFVCNLSSMNILHYDEWKNTDAVETLTYFLDAVMTDYIDKVKDIKFMEPAYNFAVRHRALGLGTLGWHDYLQSNMIAFESMQAKLLNTAIHKFVSEKCKKASRELAELYGEPELMKGTGLRNSTNMALAPTTSSGFILQVSPSIEPSNANIFTRKLAKGSYVEKNKYLEETLKDHHKNTKEVWDSILMHGGSVQHLDFLTEHEKNVFKTFGETSQREIVIQAAGRQKYIDQSQSLNLMIPSDTPPKDVSQLMIFAWEQGLKGLYYQRGSNPAQALARNINTCVSCEG